MPKHNSRLKIDEGTRVDLISRTSKVFSPAAPINRRTLFAGRNTQLERVVDAIGTRGQHAVIFGDRGVGKTSLANIVHEVVEEDYEGEDDARVVKVNCSQGDNFASVWKKALEEVILREDGGQTTVGLRPRPITEEFTAAESLPDEPSPNDVRRIVRRLGTTVIILDEFDRIRDSQGLFADTIKTLSDTSTDCTLVLVGVGRDIDELIEEHASVDRSLVQILMPPMTTTELHEILNKAMNVLGMTMDADARNLVVLLSQGLPHYTHVLGKAATLHAVDKGHGDVSLPCVKASIDDAIRNTQQSVRNAYRTATHSARKDAIFKHVLLACALAHTDELGFFSSSDVRIPLSKIMRRSYQISMFLDQMDKFASEERGNVLEKFGTRRQYRFRFANPLLQPFVIIRGLAENLFRGDLIALLQNKSER